LNHELYAANQMRRVGLRAGLTLAALLLVAIAPAWMAGAQAKKAAKATPTPALPEPMRNLGSKTAPITLEVFSDYECPTCREFYENTLKLMMSSYIAEGKVYFVHRDFPLPGHKYSLDAARWEIAASRIGKFQEVDAALYDNQRAWAADGSVEKYVQGALSAADFKRVKSQVEGCLTQTVASVKPAAQTNHVCAVDNYIAEDKALGQQVPVTGTPTYVIYRNGQRLTSGSGFVSWKIMKEFFDSLGAQ